MHKLFSKLSLNPHESLREFARQGAAKLFAKLLQRDGARLLTETAQLTDKNNRTCLSLAIEQGNIEIIQILLRQIAEQPSTLSQKSILDKLFLTVSTDTGQNILHLLCDIEKPINNCQAVVQSLSEFFIQHPEHQATLQSALLQADRNGHTPLKLASVINNLYELVTDKSTSQLISSLDPQSTGQSLLTEALHQSPSLDTFRTLFSALSYYPELLQRQLRFPDDTGKTFAYHVAARVFSSAGSRTHTSIYSLLIDYLGKYVPDLLQQELLEKKKGSLVRKTLWESLDVYQSIQCLRVLSTRKELIKTLLYNPDPPYGATLLLQELELIEDAGTKSRVDYTIKQARAHIKIILEITRDCMDNRGVLLALRTVVKLGELEIFKQLLQCSANSLKIILLYRYADKQGQTILHRIIDYARAPMAEYLLQRSSSQPDLVQQLLLQTDQFGKTAECYALENKGRWKAKIVNNALQDFIGLPTEQDETTSEDDTSAKHQQRSQIVRLIARYKIASADTLGAAMAAEESSSSSLISAAVPINQPTISDRVDLIRPMNNTYNRDRPI